MNSSKSLINISDIVSLIVHKTISEIKKINFEELGLVLKENDHNYLISSVNTSHQNESLNTLNTLQKQSNGIIFEKNSNKIVCSSSNVYEMSTPEKLQNTFSLSELQHIPGKIRLEYCEDGTMIRLYNYENEWYTSTTRCIDARSSFWGSSRSFDSMFWDIFDKNYLNVLDKNYTYVFILLHQDNRLVVRHQFNRLVYISRISNTPVVFDSKICLEEDFSNVFSNGTQLSTCIKRPKILLKLDLNNIDSVLLKYKRGIIVKIFNPISKEWNSFRLDFDNYTRAKLIRGNVPDIEYRYLQLINNKKDAYLLQKFYPEKTKQFTEIKNKFYELCKLVHELYILSHIKHEKQIDENDIFNKTLKALHSQYKSTNMPIKYHDVVNRLKSLPTKLIMEFMTKGCNQTN